ncbi:MULTISPECIES: excinuclease ABC subunit UvrA [Streptomycetaceae]|uniref:UvrABC system protein A n=1 Tax=Streptantibioticus cattleyicolor (strain ATCC 35852 / DSM 46488 / JCM 4925 / NBRC 14057 / NRRL 8057) TaxID=1003195 RepID=F8K1E3_STREN|nr:MULTISPECIES: excinuclease ABC subunit UvrA [Streptomycetaceae]AEW97438.1 excinuclease ABC, A subunit [Streptantibioticus cattleyicolor NRRL 8057 = DSM 46488]MYS61876.1 excinuclease ABC subunit UvrA [Streptomyces sp. SID5468]CCB77758.1 UvrABC system protein A [Streptantibioticus cattleyicolor NRRL 8057 = DSM 46488]
MTHRPATTPDPARPPGPPPGVQAHDPYVRVRGAREHNLRNVDADLPRDALVVFTGVSGSGKSSLAFGTVYAEAQRRYFESVAPYARRLIHQVGAPKVAAVSGLPPAVALEQRRTAPTSRSSVGTVTTVSNLLRMLYSRAGDYPPQATGRLDSDAFSPNTAAGACPECHGLGTVHRVTEESLVPDPDLTIRQGAIAAWPGAWQGKNLRDILDALGYDIDRPWRELPAEQREWILFTDEQPVVTVHPVRDADRIQRPYQGTYSSARRYVLRTFAESRSATLRARAERFLVSAACPTCHGRRLRPEALEVTFAGRSIAELAALPLAELARVLRPTADAPGDHAAATLARDLVARIDVLTELGLGYLATDRPTPTLSPGELQRLRLATQLRSGLFGVVYVLDEPSAGLHPADTAALLTVLDRLKAAGNSLFVVEHDMDLVRRADWIVDVGPAAGEHGGQVLYCGPVAGLAGVPDSATRRFLFPDAGPGTVPAAPREPTGWLRLRGVTRHNLRGLDADVPLGVLTAVTGVSGSGKSTLVGQVLAGALAAHLGTPAPAPEDEEGPAATVDGAAVTAEGLEAVDRLVRVDQKPIGRTPRSNLATYTGLFDAVRKVFAATEQARARGYGAGRFSFNVPGGRCENCQGEGFIAVELLFLPGTYAPCPQCHGTRYAPETLEVTYRGATVADVLRMTVETASEFLADVPAAARALRTLREVGLGYLRLGQPATELSGGEAQRIKLAAELQRAHRGHTVYLLDEPTTGLHPADTEVLLRQLRRLADSGNTVVVVEHDMDVVAAADWVIDLGPGGGDAGGRIVAAGPPRRVARVSGSRTAPYLAARLRPGE